MISKSKEGFELFLNKWSKSQTYDIGSILRGAVVKSQDLVTFWWQWFLMISVELFEISATIFTLTSTFWFRDHTFKGWGSFDPNQNLQKDEIKFYLIVLYYK